MKRTAAQNRRTAEREAAGLCNRCGKRPPEARHKTCKTCRPSPSTKSKRNEQRAARIAAGKCRSHTERDALPGLRVCAECREYNRVKALATARQFRADVLEAYGAKCGCCGETEKTFLEVDHINNDGAKHRQEIGANSNSLYRWLVKNNFPKDNFRLLCANCNHGRARNGGVCPHKEGK